MDHFPKIRAVPCIGNFHRLVRLVATRRRSSELDQHPHANGPAPDPGAPGRQPDGPDRFSPSDNRHSANSGFWAGMVRLVVSRRDDPRYFPAQAAEEKGLPQRMAGGV